MSSPHIEYEIHEDERCTATIYAANGEAVARTEKYDSKSNAVRGVSDLARTVFDLVLEGDININREDPA